MLVHARGYKKRGARIATRRDAVLIEADGCRVDVVITEVSSDGFRLESPAELVEGDEVQLQAGSGKPMRARIQWTRGSEAGGLFLDAPDLG
jgi:hypothetical protein